MPPLDTVENSTGDTVKSPTSLVLEYLKSKQQPINSASVRVALEQNARNPGLIAGLSNQEPPGADKGPSVGQGGSSAKAVEGKGGTGAGESSKGGSGDSPSMVNLGTNPYGDEGPNTNPTSPTRPGGTPSNVATPSSGQPMMVDPGTGTPGMLTPSDGSGPDWMSALTPAFIAALIQGAAGLGGRGGGAEFVGNAQMPSGRMMDVNPPAIGADGIPTLQITGQRPQIGASQPTLPTPPAPSALEGPMQRAMEGPIGPPLPPQPTGPGTTIIPPNPAAGAPQVPLRPGAGARGPMPGIGVGLGQRILGGLRVP